MYITKGSALILFVTSFFNICKADVLVQLNVNKPVSDVNDKFVSFSIKPEDLYNALDGPKRKIVTRTAAMLGTSYVKYLGDYNFSTEKELRSPSRVIWKGFNRWSKAINWTMIIPIKYKADEWDPMDTLNILNNSLMSGISNCIWQFGTDYSSSSEDNYVADYKTFDLMVEAFRPNVKQWKTIGSDVSEGRNAEETRRYVDMSKDFSTSYGWTKSTDDSLLNSMSPFHMDSSLRILLTKRVPVWLNLSPSLKSKKTKLIGNTGDELREGMNFAQDLGDAASTGFDAVFKPISAIDLENPNFSMYVAALHKKVMGSRVFPARPLHLFNQRHKLYTHCANSVSGGVAFMVINRDETPMHITVGSLTRLQSSEVWQYSLSMKKGAVLLNNERLTFNSSLEPVIKAKKSNGPIQIIAPALSVTYWILPGVNLEHCQFLEVEVEDADASSDEKVVQKRHSSAEKLISQLIRETALTQQPKSPGRSRRFALGNKRGSRMARSFDLDSGENSFFPTKLFNADNYNRIRREMHKGSITALDWIQSLIEIFRNVDDKPSKSLRRRTRSLDDDFDSLFSNEDEKEVTKFNKKNNVNKKFEKKQEKMKNAENFDEEEFFKKLDEFREPKYFRPPVGDVQLRYISNTKGEDIDDSKENRKLVKKSPQSERIVNTMKPMRFLPSEFNGGETLKTKKEKTQNMNIGSALNYFLSPEPFSLKENKDKKSSNKSTDTRKNGSRDDNKKNKKIADDGKVEKFKQIQKDLHMAFLNGGQADANLPKTYKQTSDNEYDDAEDYFNENSEQHEKMFVKSQKSTGKIIEEPSWLDLDSTFSKKREVRALKISLPEDDSRENLVDEKFKKRTKPRYLLKTTQSAIQKIPNKKSEDNSDNLSSNDFVDTVTKRVVKFVDIVTRHVNNLYSTFAKNPEETSHTKKVNNINKH